MHSEDFKSILAKLRPVIGDMADAFWLGTLLEPERQRDIHAVAQALAAELLDESYIGKHILLEPPPQDKMRGDYPLGSVIYADKGVCSFALREKNLQQHVAILGRSGAGKTNVGYLLVWNLLKAGKPFLVLDWRGTYRHFVHSPEGKDMLVFTLGEDKSLSFNPLQPPAGLSSSMSDAYLRNIVSLVCNTYLPGQHLLSTRGVEYLFLMALDLLGSFDKKPVTFNNVRNYVEEYQADNRERDWQISAINVLFRLTSGPIGHVMNSCGDTTLGDVLNKPVVLELTGLGSETDRSFFTQALMLWLYYHRLTEGKSESLRHSLIIEEAHHVFLKRNSVEQTVSDYTLRQFRELGQGIVLLDQNPSLLSIPVLGNCGTSIVLNLKHSADVEAAGKTLTLPKEDLNQIGRLPVGHGIVKLADRWLAPFLVKFPRFPVSGPPEPSPAERRRSGSDCVKRPVEELRSALDEAISALSDVARREKEKSEISTRERSLLLDIAKHPLSVITKRYKRLGWDPRKGTQIKRRLLEKGLIEQEKVSVPNGSVTLLKVTEKGKEFLASQGVKVKALPKNASLEHEYYKHKVAEEYRNKGFAVEEEVPIGEGKAVDLVATKDGKSIAIEVETGKSDAEGNVKKCREAGFEKVRTVKVLHQKAAPDWTSKQSFC